MPYTKGVLPGPNALWLGIGGLVFVLLVAFLLWFTMFRAYRKAAEHQRRTAWYATVTATDVRMVRMSDGGQGSSEVQVVTVDYQRDDGQAGQLAAYADDRQQRMLPGIESLREAPTFADLMSMKEGDRVFKPRGRVYPEKVEPSSAHRA